MNPINMSEIRRPIRNIDDERLRQRLSTIETPSEDKEKKGFKLIKKTKVFLIILFIAVILIALGFIFISQKRSNNKSEWQAVFLSDGQVYFGKVFSESAKDVILKNIYYLQEPEVLKPGSNIGQQGGDFVLIKLGNEIHGPYDEIRINRQHVLYIEDLKDDSKVVKAIRQHIGGN